MLSTLIKSSLHKSVSVAHQPLLIAGANSVHVNRNRYNIPPTVIQHRTFQGYSRQRLPINFGIVFVPQQEAWVVQRFGKFQRTLNPGLNFCIPIVDKIAYVQSLKEIAIDIPDQSAITSDNVTVDINGVLFLRIRDPYRASYGIEDAEFAITQLAQTTMRSEIGKIALDSVFQERETLNYKIVDAINKSSEPWGIDCLRYEIRDIQLPEKIIKAMQMQVEAERKKRAQILESEGFRDAEVNRATGARQALILDSEGKQIERVNNARGEAEAIERVAEAQALAVSKIAKALEQQNGHEAVQWAVAEKYISAFSKLAKTNNTILLPSQTGDVSSVITQAMSIYNATKNVSNAEAFQEEIYHDAPARKKSIVNK